MIASQRPPIADVPRVREAWAIPRRATPAEWAAEHRVLGEKDSSEPGRWSNLRTPYLVEPMNACADPEITDVVWMKAAQVGASEAVRNVVGYWIDQDPGPVLAVMPDQASAEEILAEKLAPLIRATPALAKHLTDRAHDVGKRKILLDNCEIHAGWAGSPQSLATRPKRYVINDEADKYPTWSGKESDPIALGAKRTTTFGHRAKRLILGTPTIRSAPIWQAWEASPIKRRLHVPCPACGEYAPMAFSQVRWPQGLPGSRAEQGAAIEDGDLAWYECPKAKCGAKIHEKQRRTMVARGVWAADDHELVEPDGKRVGRAPKSRKVAYHIPALLSPWVSWSMMAGEFIAAIGNESRMMDWRNSRLGEPYEVRAAAVKRDAFDEKIGAGHKPGLVPPWAGMLLSTADTQKDGWWWTVRAWGHGFRSRLIAHGFARTFAELRAATLDGRYGWDGITLDPIAPQMLAIDSGGGTADDVGSDLNRTDQVYQFALSDPARIFAVKGFGGHRELEVPIRQTYVSYAPPGGKAPAQVALYHLKTGYFKDVLAARIAAPATATDGWELHSGIDADYVRQLTSEHKVILRKGRGQVARWVPVTAGAANHLWDCEVYQQAAAMIAHVELLPAPTVLAEQRRLAALPQEPVAGGDGWDSAVGDWR